jgi:glutathione S-transferase
VLEFLILLCENYALYLKDFGVSQVREIVSILDIDALFYPCPKNGPTFRPKAIEMGGKKQFPYMVDPNTGTAMYESDNIIKYLVDKYGDGKVPLLLNLGMLTVCCQMMTSFLGSCSITVILLNREADHVS